ncbi:E3 ubiquitin-protein ligase RNF170-like [Biomphalaria glabrata]|uniref:E3 ubiquitin-protein ligase RNF170 n=2 Tax=Biomphalaria TaxID=6525 RepID=A0A9U8EM32_BIOGL|nr:E3 ubiquitin-protein ligase RNF170-like [Biomphalaria glabrata]KAI8786908.1 calmodulin-binding transcription activator 1 [Biomphalaria glabrata]KAK0062860.1 calmodulin-binding transcription activator 1 [Biomphalaria pfeifferi]
MNDVRKKNLVEGIGNEVLYVLFTILAGCLAVFLYFHRRQRLGLTIHPDSVNNVATTREQLQTEGGQRGSQRRANHANDGSLQCPICLGSAAFAIETNCGHVFCGHCMITYWEHQTWLGAVRCPSCRTQVSLLLLNFTSEEHAHESDERREVITKVNQYNRRYSGEARTIQEYLQDLPTLLRHTFHEFFSIGGLMWMFRLRIVILVIAAFVYLVSPLDILPEGAFGIIGFLDDIFIILFIAVYISVLYRNYVAGRGVI